MLLLLLSLISHDLIECYAGEKDIFNETELTNHFHKSFRDVQAIVEEVEHKAHNKKYRLRAADQEENHAAGEGTVTDTTETPATEHVTPLTSTRTKKRPRKRIATKIKINPTKPTPTPRPFNPDYTYPDYLPKFEGVPDSYELHPLLTHPDRFADITLATYHIPFPTTVSSESNESSYSSESSDSNLPIYPANLPEIQPTLNKKWTTYRPPPPGLDYEYPTLPPDYEPSLLIPIEDLTAPGLTTMTTTSKTLVPGYFPVPELPTASARSTRRRKKRTKSTIRLWTSTISTLIPPELDPELNYDSELPKYKTELTRYTFSTASKYEDVTLVSSTTLHPKISAHVQDWLAKEANSTTPAVRINIDVTDLPTITLTEITTPAWIPNQNPYISKYRARAAPSAVQRQGTTGLDQSTTWHIDPPDFAGVPFLTEETTTTSTPNPIPTTEVTDEGYPGHPTATAKQEEFIIERPNGMFSLGTTPSYDENTRTTIIDGRPAYVPVEVDLNWASPTVAGDVLMGNVGNTIGVIHKDPYRERLYDEMDEYNFGHMTMVVTRLAYVVATKDDEDLRDLLMHVEPIINVYVYQARLAWMGEPLVHVTINLAKGLYSDRLDELKSYATMVNSMLRYRKQSLSVEVNSIIDFADMLYTDEEGELLFDVLKEFEMYPTNSTKPAKKIVEDMIEAYFAPYKRLDKSERRQRLLDSVNYALITRFPNLQNYRRSNEEFGDDLIGLDVHPTPKQPAEQLQIEKRQNQRKKIRNLRANHSILMTYNGPHKRSKIKQRHKNLEQTYRHNHDGRKRQYSSELKLVEVRNMKPIREIQKRYNIIHKNSYEKNYRVPINVYENVTTNRPTTDYKRTEKTEITENNELLSRRTLVTSTNKPLQFFHVPRNNGTDAKSTPVFRNSDKSERHGSNLKLEQTEKRSRDEHFISGGHNKDESVTIKAEILRKIVDAYSAEEAKLKMNLIDVLIHGNRTFELDSKTNSQASESEEVSAWKSIHERTDTESSSSSCMTSDERYYSLQTQENRDRHLYNKI